MAILSKVEIHFVKVDPKRPETKFNPADPRWEVQCRTKDREQAQEWKGLGLETKLVEDEETGETYYRMNLRRRAKKSDGSPQTPVEVVDGRMQPVDPKSIGSGSIANVKVFIREYTYEGVKKRTGVLQGLQLLVHKIYVPEVHEDFGTAETVTVFSDEEGDY